jgi:hypothetical protein
MKRKKPTRRMHGCGGECFKNPAGGTLSFLYNTFQKEF